MTVSSSKSNNSDKRARNRIVVVGSANQDLTSYTATVPTIGETVIGEAFETSCGGKGANQAVAAGSMSINPVSMICKVGDDVFGSNLLAHLRRVDVDVDVDDAVLPGVSSGTAAITVDTVSGDNMIIVTPGANHELTPDSVETSLKKLKDDVAVVVVQLEIKPDAALQALKTGKELGAVTILNPAPAPETYSLDDFYQYADIVIPNESELRKICGKSETNGADADEKKTNDNEEVQMAKALLGKGVGKAVVVTLGARGAMIVTKDGVVTKVDAPDDLPARKEPVQDTVGAGDAFCGSLSTYLSTGMELPDAAGRACGFASMSVRRRGASYPAADELPDSLRLPEEYRSRSALAKRAKKSKPPITFVTGNKNKLEEVKQILLSRGGGGGVDSDDLPFEIVNKKIDLPELQGDPTEIAAEKCRKAAETVKGACLTEDTSLCFNALNGMPGPFIKWFLDNCGHDGLNRMLDGFDDKSAYAQTVVAFTAGPGEEVHVFDGRTDGRIVPPRGSLEFGWDPIFEPDEGDGGKTYAEMSKEDKNAISHRGRSFAKFRSFLVKNSDKIKASIK